MQIITSNTNSKKKLLEAVCHGMTLRNRMLTEEIYNDFEQIGQMLVEADLTQDQIRDVFRAVSDDPESKGWNFGTIDTNPTGKNLGIDSSLNKRGIQRIKDTWNKVKNVIELSGPVSSFGVKVDEIQNNLVEKLGKDSKLLKALDVYRKFGEKHPVMQQVIIAGLTAAAATAMAPGMAAAGGTAAVFGGLSMLDRMLMGDRVSSALWNGFKKGAIAFGLGQIFQAATAGSNVPSSPAELAAQGKADVAALAAQGKKEIAQITAQKGDTLSDIAKNIGTSVKELLRINPQITNPNDLGIGEIVNVGGLVKDPNIYRDAVGTAADTAEKVARGVYSGSRYGISESVDWSRIKNTLLIQESLKLPLHSAVYLTPVGVERVYRLVEEQILGKEAADEKNRLVETFNKILNEHKFRTYLTESGEDPEAVLEDVVTRLAAFESVDIDVLLEYSGFPKDGSEEQDTDQREPNLGYTRNPYDGIGRSALKDKIKGWWGKAKEKVSSVNDKLADKFGNKITYEKLDLHWRRNKGENKTEGSVDKEEVFNFLRKMGVKPEVIDRAFKQVGVPDKVDPEELKGDDKEGGEEKPTPDPVPPTPVPDPVPPTPVPDPVPPKPEPEDDEKDGSDLDGSWGPYSIDPKTGEILDGPGSKEKAGSDLDVSWGPHSIDPKTGEILDGPGSKEKETPKGKKSKYPGDDAVPTGGKQSNKGKPKIDKDIDKLVRQLRNFEPSGGKPLPTDSEMYKNIMFYLPNVDKNKDWLMNAADRILKANKLGYDVEKLYNQLMGRYRLGVKNKTIQEAKLIKLYNKLVSEGKFRNSVRKAGYKTSVVLESIEKKINSIREYKKILKS